MSQVNIKLNADDLPKDRLLVQFTEDDSFGSYRIVESSGNYTLLIHLNSPTGFPDDYFRKLGAGIYDELAQLNYSDFLLDLAGPAEFQQKTFRKALFEGMLFKSFHFDKYLSNKQAAPAITVWVDYPPSAAADAKNEILTVQKVCAAQNFARSWAHEPPNIINPVTLAERAVHFAQENNLELTILDDEQLESMGAGAIYSVGKGSATPSRMLIMKYAGKISAPPVVVIGKAITFDTGGYSLKTKDGMLTMKYDKSGAMAVFGILQAAASLKLETPVIGIIAAAENMVAGNAYRPSDIITSLSGKTIEIISTDAEGRMVLADAITYACENLAPRAILDIATLTGGVVVSLGKVRAGVMGSDKSLIDALCEAGERSGERLWPFPLDDEYLNLIKGTDSDLKNSAGKPQASAIIGGTFLKQFLTKEIPWAHIDIAGMSNVEKHPYFRTGGTGFGVRLVVDYLQNL